MWFFLPIPSFTGSSPAFLRKRGDKGEGKKKKGMEGCSYNKGFAAPFEEDRASHGGNAETAGTEKVFGWIEAKWAG